MQGCAFARPLFEPTVQCLFGFIDRSLTKKMFLTKFVKSKVVTLLNAYPTPPINDVIVSPQNSVKKKEIILCKKDSLS